MKFMKLGSRPDTFYSTESMRSVSSEVSNDIIIEVNGTRYLLHKFPLLSKCARLQKLCLQNPEISSTQIVQLPDFPGGTEAFELCAKFCYGITVTLSAYNIVSIRCAAEYLQMSEHVEKGNLVHKLEAFFASCILQGWRDTIVALQSTKAFPMLSEDLGITSRCIEAIASKVSSHPVDVNSSNIEGHLRNKHKGGGWWAKDLAELGLDHYWRTMIAVKSAANVPSNLVGYALKSYASKRLTNMSRDVDDNVTASKQKLLLESIVGLLPAEKGSVSCSFLLKLLRAANILRASSSTKTELMRRVGLQLEEASVNDLLIPRLPSSDAKYNTTYDVDLVMTILDQFMSQGRSPQVSPVRNKGEFERRRRSRSAEHLDSFQESRRSSSSSSHSSKLKVAKLVDGYLQEIAKDKNLPLSRFVAVAEKIPRFARRDHDDLYKAIDVYLKGHPELKKSERKHLCRSLDCKKLSMEACTHAARNEMLPLRVLVQVLFFEQARATMAGGQVTEVPSHIKEMLAASNKNSSSKTTDSLAIDATAVIREDQLSHVSGLNSNISTLKMKLVENDDLKDDVRKTSTDQSLSMIPMSRSKTMFSKLWPINRIASEKN